MFAERSYCLPANPIVRPSLAARNGDGIVRESQCQRTRYSVVFEILSVREEKFWVLEES